MDKPKYITNTEPPKTQATNTLPERNVMDVEFEAIVPQVQGAYKSLPEGGARIQLELDPVSANKYFNFMAGHSDKPFNVSMTVVIPRTFGGSDDWVSTDENTLSRGVWTGTGTEKQDD